MAKQTSLRFYPYSQSDSGSSSSSSTHRSIDSDGSESLCGLGPRKKAHTAEKPAAKHRQSGYNLEWGKSFPWLEYSPAENGLYCSLCISHQRTNARCSIWIKEPCRQLRRDKIVDHQKSQIHIESVRAERDKVESSSSGGIVAAFSQQVNLQRLAVVGALKIIYWLVKEEIAHHTKYESLLQLAVSLNCDYLRELIVSGNAHYTSHRIINEFVHVLSACVEEDTLTKVKSSQFMGTLCDESTDVGACSQLAMFVQIVYKGKSGPYFLKLVQIENEKADTIEQNILSTCQSAHISTSKIMGFGSDGASNMSGRHSGVGARLKQQIPELVMVHCCAHRVALAASQSADKIP